MKGFLTHLWSDLIESFWFVPSMMAVSAVIASAFLVYLDRHGDWASVGWVWSGGASGARSLLSTVATSMITVAGTVFSITIAALTLASQQFGPRLLRNFTVDRGNQIVLGTFVSTFLYCLMVLRTVRGQNEGPFVPNLSVSMAVLLACASLGVLIYFIHHLSVSIQAETLLASVGRDLRQDLRRLTPPEPGAASDSGHQASLPRGDPHRLRSAKSGYIQTVDRPRLISLAEENDLILRLPLRPGDFVSAGEPLIETWSRLRQGTVGESTAESLCSAIQIGLTRTPWQDARYGIRQLTEIGARALSPGINDPFTAMSCLDWLTDALGELAGNETAPGVAFGESGTVRLIEEPVGFPELLALGIDPFRAYGADSVILTCHLLHSIARLARRTSIPERCDALLNEARTTLEAAKQSLVTAADQRRLEAAFASVAAATEESML